MSDTTSSESEQKKTSNLRRPASFFVRFKAFIVDMFMIYTPILYFLTYGVMGGSESFRESELGPFIAVFLFGIILSCLWGWKGQSPGKRFYGIAVVNERGGKLSLFRAYIRFWLFLFSTTILVGVLLPLFRKDKRALHDLLAQTFVVYDPSQK